MADTRPVKLAENGAGPYGQRILVGPHTLAADEPESMGGRDTGPNPYELVAAGLAACTSMTLRMYAAQKAWPLAHIAVTVTHAKTTQEDGIKRDVFHRKLALTGDLTEEQRNRLLEIANKCPVHRTLENSADIETSLA